MFKKFLSVILVILMLVALSSCGSDVYSEFNELDTKVQGIMISSFDYEGKESVYEDIISRYNTAAENNKKREVKKLITELQQFYDEVAPMCEKQLDDIVLSVEEGNKNLSGEVKKSYKKDIEEIKKAMENKEYSIAYEKLRGYMAFAPQHFTSDEKLDISVSQIDCSEYPTVRLYLSVTDKNGKTPKNLQRGAFTIIEDGGNIRKSVASVMQLDQKEGISINIVADASGSMAGSAIDTAKSTMARFLGQVQYDYGDKVALTVFSNTIESRSGFVDEYADIKNQISQISAGGGTALYDTLYTSVQYTARQNGARCVIAFTDGLDEHSIDADENDVIRIANDYKIPIFIIGIGSANYSEVARIANETGGFYRNISSINDLSEIYAAIYRQQKEMYVVEYTSENDDKYSNHSVSVSYKSGDYEGAAEAYTFLPSQINPATSDASDNEIENAIKNYLESYVQSMNSGDSSYMLPYVIPNSPIYNTQKKYIKNDYYEELLSFYICSEIKMEGEDSCVVSVHEIYNVETPEHPLRHHEQEATYRIKRDVDGVWKMYDFVGAVRNHL